MLYRALFVVLLSAWCSPGSAGRAAPDVEELARADLAFALEALEEQCAGLLRSKNIDLRRVGKELTRACRDVETESDHFMLLQRLLARLRDGHARVEPGSAWPQGVDLPWPEASRGLVHSGLFFCRVGKKLYIRNAWGDAAANGFEPGLEVVKVDGVKAGRWFEQLMEVHADTTSCGTDHHLFYSTSRWGFMREPNTRVKFELREGRKPKRRTITFTDDRSYLEGPAVLPEEYESVSKSVRVGRTPAGFGYIHYRYSQADIVEGTDKALAKLADVKGIVLDFRGNSGGGFDHDGLESRFIPPGRAYERPMRAPLEGAGANPYGGPLVVIVDASVVSAGETGAGTFKEDSRAYVIGETPTAGVSSQKTRIELPSGRFQLYVSVRSNKSWFNGGNGLEGVGVSPDEALEYDPEELASGVDTLIRRADELLLDFPSKRVRYDPAEFGWSAD